MTDLPPPKGSFIRDRPRVAWASLNLGVKELDVARRVVARVATLFAVTAVIATAFVAIQPASVSDALSGSQFDPGNIISNANFYDSNAMSEADIQYFLDSQIGTCSNSLCLNVLQVDTVSKPGDHMCPGGYAGAAAEPVSRVIFKVQQGCGISAKVILVTLQKEQSLVTSRGPGIAVLRKAMGYGCPDSSVCDSTYYGIFNQVYQASRQLKRYGLSAPDNISFHYFPVGPPSSVRTNPSDYDPAGNPCFSQTVSVQNAATAALYYYTPYTPNAAALANLTGSGDGCSSYGNRNFWVFYNNWFGSPSYPPGSPEGAASSTASTRAIHVTGWAVDPSSPTAAVAVAVQVESSWFSTVANVADPNGEQNFPGSGPNHGFDMTVAAAPGLARVCITFVNVGPGANVSYSCQPIMVPDYPAPVGAIESATTTPGTISLSGWAVRPDLPTAAVNVAANVGSSWYQLSNGSMNATAPTGVEGAGPNQGFSGTIKVAPGNQTVCIWASSTGGVGVKVACTTLAVPSAPVPVGAIETATGSPGTISLTGWTVRPDVPAGLVNVAANIGNSWFQLTAGQPDAAAPSKVSGAGSNQGFSGTISASPGVQNVCIWATSTAGVGALIACQNVTVTSVPSPVGAIEKTVVRQGSVSISGWAVRPDVPVGLVNVAANIGNSWFQLTAGQPDAVAPTKVTGAGSNQGFSGTINASPGVQNVCIWATSTAGVGVLLTCTTVDLPAGGAPIGDIESIATSPGTIVVTGWAVRPDSPSGAVNIAGSIDGNWYQFTGGQPDAIAPVKSPGAGPNQGFTGTIASSAGIKNLCVWMTPTRGGGVQVVCTAVTVP